MKQDQEEPTSITTSPLNAGDVSYDSHIESKSKPSIFKTIKEFITGKTDTTLRETIEDYIEDNQPLDDEPSISLHEKRLISNVLNLKGRCAQDVMIPRADIIAISEDTSQEDILSLLAQEQYSRIPVYKDTLDHVIGSIHIKDVLASLAQNKALNIAELTRDVPIVSPTMQISDLLLQMRMSRRHLALVVDEYGGIDGLITINDVIESIIGEIDDEHDTDEPPSIQQLDDGSIAIDARYDLEDFEDEFGQLLNEEERDENDTLGGLVFFLAGRVPSRGEILTHKSGMLFEILEADPRRVSRICIRNIPLLNEQ